MPEKPEVKDVEQPAVPKTDPELKVDEFVESAFIAMGYEKPFPKSMIVIYNAMKRKKDRLQAGRLQPEGFAIVATLSDLFEGKFNFLRG